MSRKPPSQRHRRGRARGRRRQGPRGRRRHRRRGDHEARDRADGRAPDRADAAQAQPGRRLRLPGLRLARPATRSTGTPPSSARTAPRRSPRRRPGAASAASSSPRTRSPSCDEQDRLLAGPAGPAHRADGAARRRHALRADLVGRRVRADRPSTCNGLGQPGRGDLLHLRQDLQRGGVRLPAVRPRLRHQQPARLLEHVPRVHLGRRWPR